MILYITSSSHVNQFDRVLDENMVIKKMIGEYSLKELLLVDMNAMGHFEKIIIDLEALIDTQKEFLEALKNFKLISDSVLVIYAPALDKKSASLLRDLIFEEVYNILIETEYEKFKPEAEKILTLGYTKEDALRLLGEDVKDKKKVYTGYSFIATGVQVTVCGNGKRAGTTTIALNMAYNLTKKGAKVAVIFFEKDEKLREIAEYYQIKPKGKKDLFYEKDGLLLLSSSVPIAEELDTCNFIVLDIGEYTEEKAGVFASSKKNLYVSFSKSSDLKNLELFSQGKENMNYLLRGAEEDKQAFIQKVLIKKQAYFLEDSKSYFEEIKNDQVYREIFDDYIVPV